MKAQRQFSNGQRLQWGRQPGKVLDWDADADLYKLQFDDGAVAWVSTLRLKPLRQGREATPAKLRTRDDDESAFPSRLKELLDERETLQSRLRAYKLMLDPAWYNGKIADVHQRIDALFAYLDQMAEWKALAPRELVGLDARWAKNEEAIRDEKARLLKTALARRAVNSPIQRHSSVAPSKRQEAVRALATALGISEDDARAMLAGAASNT